MKINNEEPLLKIVDTYTLYERHDYKKSNSCKDVQFCCDQCDFKSQWKGNLKKHIDSIHGNVSYTCDLCDYKTKRKRNIKRHKDSVHGDVRYACRCSWTFVCCD